VTFQKRQFFDENFFNLGKHFFPKGKFLSRKLMAVMWFPKKEISWWVILDTILKKEISFLGMSC